MKLLILTSRFPFPVEKGDKLRLYHQIKGLSKNHDLSLCALSDYEVSAESINEIEKYCKKVHIIQQNKIQIYASGLNSLMGKRPLQVAYFYQKSIQTKIKDIINQEQPDHIYCQLIRMAEYLFDSQIPMTLDFMDAFSAGALRLANNSTGLKKLFWKREAKKLSNWEQRAYQKFHRHIVISKQDEQSIINDSSQTISIVPNGVDLEHFKPKPQSKKYDLVFVGNMGYSPNIQAAIYLVEKVYPLLVRSFPDLKILIAGARPSAAVKALGSDNITISGWVEDIRKAYLAAKIFVAPLFIGAGLQNKILEAMALGLPCITTDLVNNAIGANPGTEILIANSPETFSQKAKNLLQNNDLCAQISNKGNEYISANFSWEVSVNKLDKILTHGA